jgi:hypothetical protein
MQLCYSQAPHKHHRISQPVQQENLQCEIDKTRYKYNFKQFAQDGFHKQFSIK